MITNKSTTRFSKLRKLSALPLVVMMLGLFSFTIREGAVVQAKHKIVVMLDAGHGGNDEGGKNNNGLQEKDLTLALTKRLAQLAPEYNVWILQTRTSDEYMTLGKRTEAANSSNADVYLSVHINKTGTDNKVSNDYAIYISDANAQYANSKVLATQIANGLYSIGVRPEIVNKKGLQVLQANNRPAILVECGNIDKADDVARLENPKRMDALCRSLLSGVVAYANNR